MSFRLTNMIVFTAIAAGGFVTSPEVLSGEPIRLFVTFLGLIAAGILPTVSLVIGSMGATGRSVQKTTELYDQLEGASRALFATFGWVAVCVVLLVIHAILPSMSVTWKFSGLFLTVDDISRRAAQALVAVCTLETVFRALVIPKVLKAVLVIKRDIAIFEAKRALVGNVPTAADMNQMFVKKEGFGAKVVMERTEP